VSIDLRLIRYFVATAAAGSATQAAAQLHVSQPVLSRQLRQLEQQLGLRLFEREGRGLRLSRAAEDFLPEARALLRCAEDVERAAESLAGGRLSALHLAVPSTTLTDVVAPFLATFGSDDPVPMVRELDPRGAVAAIRAGADLAVVTLPPTRALASRPVAVLPVWAYIRHDDPWAGHASVHVTDLAARPLTLLTSDFRPRALLDAAMDAAGIGYGEIIEVTNAQVAQAIAASGRGIAVVSDDPRFDLVPLRIDTDTGPIRIHLYAAWEPRHHAARTLALLADRLATFCVQRYGADVAITSSPIASLPSGPASSRTADQPGKARRDQRGRAGQDQAQCPHSRDGEDRRAAVGHPPARDRSGASPER
jgi:DNA-binding transcriptional LysR family regulator